MTAFSIVPIDSTTDFKLWSDLFRAYVVFCNDKDVLPVEQYQHTFDRLVDPKGDIHGFTLLSTDIDGDKTPVPVPVGFVAYLFHPTVCNQRGRCYLAELWVDPAHRLKGGARLLIEAVKKEAIVRGNLKVYWHAKIDNKVAQGLYNKLAKNEEMVYEIKL
jgi:ribosomal protein S18 acetylase RimI-like enzyme